MSVPWNTSLLVALTACLSVGAGYSRLLETLAKSAACTAPEYRQFDFWVGDWDVSEISASTRVIAHARVDLVLDSCVLWERYDGADGSKGQSFSVYDASRRVWHQSWATNRGQLLVIEGDLKNGEMILSGTDRTLDGNVRIVRGTWKPVKEGVRETAVRSTDAGKTWDLWFDLIFRPHKPQ